jgi:hypothetical protein
VFAAPRPITGAGNPSREATAVAKTGTARKKAVTTGDKRGSAASTGEKPKKQKACRGSKSKSLAAADDVVTDLPPPPPLKPELVSSPTRTPAASNLFDNMSIG